MLVKFVGKLSLGIDGKLHSVYTYSGAGREMLYNIFGYLRCAGDSFLHQCYSGTFKLQGCLKEIA